MPGEVGGKEAGRARPTGIFRPDLGMYVGYDDPFPDNPACRR
jgi:hypothetical protein